MRVLCAHRRANKREMRMVNKSRIISLDLHNLHGAIDMSSGPVYNETSKLFGFHVQG
jgi:hypothetical protein